ncbi:hypothetical protein J8273_1045 [Carpediemonas membranifera]|uniref:Uncharacterized protein n=1 Tax=Carpediemonas membranifera TaxID=201153 RepID=A0A8J6E4M4_9EUKA|nr:hypothetical protein J8273_1045 [Carpediemonas membranifera]|eukprot:KAG9397136.1 hypothetical protein J8273_1045 [Carpediemonas membranifera]
MKTSQVKASSTSRGATLQSYNNDLIKSMDEMNAKREDLKQEIAEATEEKAKLENDMKVIREKLTRVEESLNKKIASKAEYDRTIKEVESAYMRILESSQALLSVVRRDAGILEKKV